MNVVEVAGITVEVDPGRTRDAYKAIMASSARECDCAYCRNFRALGTKPFPGAVLEFFQSAGIEASRPAETYEYAQTAPGQYLYGGEYYFFGSAPLTDGSALSPTAGFNFTFTRPSPLAQSEFQAQGAVCFLFLAQLPWVIGDAP